MRDFFLVVRFECLNRLKVPAVGLALGLFALTAPLLPLWKNDGVEDVRMAVAMVLGSAFATAVAIGLGASILAGPLVTGREGFFLDRPLGLGALWWGRATAVLALAFGSGFLVLLPALSARFVPEISADLFRSVSRADVGFVLGSLAYVISILGVLAFVTAVFRILIVARSLWALIVPASIVVGYFVLQRIGPSFFHVFGDFRVHFFAVMLCPVVAAFAAASLGATLWGRADRGRAARVAGLIASGLLVGISLLLWAGVGLIAAASPADVLEIEMVETAPRGPWILERVRVERFGVEFDHTFLVNTENGQWRTVHPVRSFSSEGSFSGDGRRVALSRPSVDGNRIDIEILDLSGEAAKPVGLLPTGTGGLVLLSPAGTKAAFIDEFTVRIFDVGTGDSTATVDLNRQLFAVATEETGGAMVYLGYWADSGETIALEVRHIDSSGGLSPVVWRQGGILFYSWRFRRILSSPAAVFPIADPETGGVRLIVRSPGDGKILWTASIDEEVRVGDLLAIDPETVIVSIADRSRGVLWALLRLGPGGVEWRRDLGPSNGVLLGPMTDDRTVVVTIHPNEWNRSAWASLVDVEDGTVRPVERGNPKAELVPAARTFQWRPPRPGSPGSRLLIRNRKELVFLDEGGTLRPVDGSGAR